MSATTTTTDSRSNAAGVAIAALRPHADNPTIAGILAELKAVAPDESEGESEDTGNHFEKAMFDTSAARVTLAKSGHYEPVLAGSLKRADVALQVEHLKKTSGAFQGDALRRSEAIAKAERRTA